MAGREPQARFHALPTKGASHRPGSEDSLIPVLTPHSPYRRELAADAPALSLSISPSLSLWQHDAERAASTLMEANVARDTRGKNRLSDTRVKKYEPASLPHRIYVEWLFWIGQGGQ